MSERGGLVLRWRLVPPGGFRFGELDPVLVSEVLADLTELTA